MNALLKRPARYEARGDQSADRRRTGWTVPALSRRAGEAAAALSPYASAAGFPWFVSDWGYADGESDGAKRVWVEEEPFGAFGIAGVKETNSAELFVLVKLFSDFAVPCVCFEVLVALATPICEFSIVPRYGWPQ